MPGKNQQKRIEKRIAHAKMVWTRKALAARVVWDDLAGAEATVEQFRHELTDEGYAEVKQQLTEHRTAIRDALVKARDTYLAISGEEDSELADFTE
jgi:DNA-binding transcriptional MocR family regulator